MIYLEDSKFVKIFIAISTIVLVFLAFNTTGVSDDGDSLQHFYFSKWAFVHPENFFHHWAKPIFVTLTAPFAQFGIHGIKIFNIICLAISQWLAYKTAEKLNIPNAGLAAVFLIAAPFELYFTLSGLTEPLFAVWLIWSIYLMVKGKEVSATLVLSFLPFVRSEGWIIMCVFFIFILLKKYWKLIPLLTVGHIFYGLIGAPFHENDILWPFHANPYASINGFYGRGNNIFHFVNGMSGLAGNLLCAFFILGFLYAFVKTVGNWLKMSFFSKEEIWLIYGVAVAYTVAHSLFWYYGLFNSFGMLRVMIGIMPVLAIIGIRGANLLLNRFQLAGQKWAFFGVFLLGIGLIKSSYDKSGRYFFRRTGSQEAAQKMIAQFGSSWKSNPKQLYYFDAPAIEEVLDIDYFDDKIHRYSDQLLTDEIPDSAIVILDHWFSIAEKKMTQEKIDAIPDLKHIGTFKGLYQLFGTTSTLEVYRKISKPLVPSAILYENDIEKEIEDTDTKVFFEGKKSFLLSKKREYSPTYVGLLKNINAENKNTAIRFSAKVLNEKMENAPETSGIAVITVTRNGKEELWLSKPLFKQGAPSGKWLNFEFEADIPPMLSNKDKVCAYFWNTSPQNVFIDNIKVEVLK